MQSSWIAPHGHAADDVVTPRDGAVGANRMQDLTCATDHPPAASVAQDASGAGPSNIFSSPVVHSKMVHQVKEFADVDTPVAVSALEEAGGDANAASDYLLEARQKSEARQSAQRAQASIEEAAIDKGDGGSGKPPNSEGATTQMQPAGGQEHKSSQKTNEKHSSKQPKRKPMNNGKQAPG